MFIVIEMQTNGTTTSVLPVTTFQTLNEAEAKYHQILSIAAVSSVEKHTAIVIDENGTVFDNKCYYHGVEPSEE